MKRGSYVLIAMAGSAVLCLSGCQKNSPADHGESHGGRYLGIGTYPAGQLWKHMAGKPGSDDAQAATLADDEQIIAIVDSRTGEVRQCGNYSGRCIGMNPWAGPANTSPVKLAKHAAELQAELAKADKR